MDFPTLRLSETIKPNRGIVSIWGDFGVGKTTFALQTAINTVKFGNNILYIYTKPNFPSQRIGAILKDDPIELLDNITFIKATDFKELVSIILNLEFIIINNLKERERTFNLIVVDSLTEIYGLELIRDKKEKNVNLNYELNQILGTLSYIFEKFSIEILVVNELSRKSKGDDVFEVQRGGKIMDFWISNTIKLERTEVLSERNLIINKAHENKEFEVKAKLTQYGFE